MALVLWNALLFCGVKARFPHNDFCRMYYAARAYWQGEPMYAPNPATPQWLGDDASADLRNMNPPHFHLVLLPLAWLDAGPALVFWWGANLLCLGLALHWIVREVDLECTPRIRQFGVLFLLGFCATASQIIASQLAPLVILPVTMAWIAARHGRWLRCGAWLGLVLSVKPFLLLIVPYLLVRRRWAAVAA